MATSIYIYKNKDDYDKLYKGKTDAWTFETPIQDLFLKPTEGYDVEDSILSNKLWIVTNHTPNEKYRPDLARTIVFFTNGSCFDFLTGDEKLDVKEKISYNPKNNMLEFYPRRLREPLFSIRVDKIIGGRPSKKLKIKDSYKYYDMANNRINLFV